MIYFTAGGALYEAFAELFICTKISIRTEGVQTLIDLLKNGDVVVHNAAVINPKTEKEAYRGNVLWTKQLLKALIESEKQVKFVFISSMSFLAKNKKYLKEKKMSPYAYSKYLAELSCLMCPYSVHCVRFSTLFYGDEGRDGLSKLIFEAVNSRKIELINNGKAKRDFMPLTTAVQYLKKICDTPLSQKVFNIASGKAHSFAQLAKIIKKEIPEVVIKNKKNTTATPFVLSDFKKKDVQILGEIEIDLRSHIQHFIKKINENNRF